MKKTLPVFYPWLDERLRENEKKFARICQNKRTWKTTKLLEQRKKKWRSAKKWKTWKTFYKNLGWVLDSLTRWVTLRWRSLQTFPSTRWGWTTESLKPLPSVAGASPRPFKKKQFHSRTLITLNTIGASSMPIPKNPMAIATSCLRATRKTCYDTWW